MIHFTKRSIISNLKRKSVFQRLKQEDGKKLIHIHFQVIFFIVEHYFIHLLICSFYFPLTLSKSPLIYT